VKGRLALTVGIAAVASVPVAGAQFASAGDEKLTTQSKISTVGLGPVRVGMTKREATEAAGRALRFLGPATGNCRQMKPRRGPVKAVFMLIDGRVARVDVDQPSITTRSGVGVGDTEAKVRSTYPGRIRRSPHQYVPGGEYLEFVPRDSSEQDYRVIFETNAANRVTLIRAGTLPGVRYAEGCA